MSKLLNNDALPIVCNTYKSTNDNRGKSEHTTWQQIKEQLSKHKICQAKTDAQLISLIDLDGETRSSKNACAVYAVGLDYDGGTDPDQIRKNLADFEYVMYSTWSHSEEEPKFRVYIPLSSPVNAKDWIFVWEAIVQLAGGKPDLSTKDSARIFYLPSCPPR